MLKSRFVRITLIVVAVLLFVGYFAFSTFLFSPVEGDFEDDVSALIPRGVDFFGAQADLNYLLSPFPRIAAMDEIEGTEAWETFQKSPEYTDLVREYDIESTLAELDQTLGQLPLGLGKNPQKIFGGRDLAVAGYFKGADIATSDWAVYGRVNWAGKLGLSMLSYPGILKLDAQGLNVEKADGVFTLSGGQLTAPLHVARVRDVVVVGTSAELVSAANDLALRSGEDSFFQSARYFDHIQNERRSESDLELFVDVRKLVENMSLTGPWPDLRSHDFSTAFLGRLFQGPACKEVIGVVNYDTGVRVRLHGEFSSEHVTPAQARIYRERGFSQDEIARDIARLAPADTSLFVYLHGPIGELLTQVLDSVEPALRENLEDAFKSTGDYNSLAELIAELDGSLKDRLALIVRENDYPLEMGIDAESGERVYVGPPNDGSPVFAVAVVAWISNADPVVGLRDSIGRNSTKFGLQGRGSETGYFQNNVAGFETREYWSEFIPGTGVIATLNTHEHCVVTNVIPMLSHVVKTYSQDDRKYPRLADRPEFEGLITSSLEGANVLIWANPRAAASTLEKQAERFAKDNVRIDWPSLRAKEEARVIPQLFPGKRRGQLTPDEQTRLDEVVDPILENYGQKVHSEQVPVLMAKKVREITYLESISSFLATLKLDPKSFELVVQAVTPLD